MTGWLHWLTGLAGDGWRRKRQARQGSHVIRAKSIYVHINERMNDSLTFSSHPTNSGFVFAAASNGEVDLRSRLKSLLMDKFYDARLFFYVKHFVNTYQLVFVP
jgi:hypothetical protein